MRRENWPDEGPRTGDRCEVVAKQDATVRWHEVLGVVVVLGRSGAKIVGLNQVLLDVLGVEPVRNQVRAYRGKYEPHGVDGFAAGDGEDNPRDATKQRDSGPQRDLGRGPLAVFSFRYCGVHTCRWQLIWVLLGDTHECLSRRCE